MDLFGPCHIFTDSAVVAECYYVPFPLGAKQCVIQGATYTVKQSGDLRGHLMEIYGSMVEIGLLGTSKWSEIWLLGTPKFSADSHLKKIYNLKVILKKKKEIDGVAPLVADLSLDRHRGAGPETDYEQVSHICLVKRRVTTWFVSQGHS